jgi:cell division protein FtsB
MRRRRPPILAKNRLERWWRERSNRWRTSSDSPIDDAPVLRRLWLAPRRRVTLLRVLIAAACASGAYMLLWGDHGYFHNRALERERAKLKRASSQLDEEVRIVRQRLAEAAGDPFELERIARERYGLVRPGEVVYRFRSQDVLAGAGEGSTGSPPDGKEPYLGVLDIDRGAR